MERPLSIVWFERCYLGSLVVSLVNTALRYPEAVAKLADNPATAQFGPSFVPMTMAIGVVISIGVSLLLWYFAARKAAAVAKWIITIFFVINVIMVAFSVISHNFASGLAAVIAIVVLVLYAISVWQLFRPDAEAWFAGNGPIDGASSL